MQRHIYDYPHSEVVRPRIARLLGRSLGWVEGESEHKRMRQLVAPALSNDAIKRGAHDIFAAASNLELAIEKHLQANDGSAIISICDWVNRATLDVIGRFGFGHDFEGGSSAEASKILGAWRNMAIMGISKRGFIALMLLRRFPIINRLPLKALRAQEDVRRTIHQGVAKELLRRDKDMEDSFYGNDLLSRLLLAHKSKKMDISELMDHISMFIMAGSETTSQTLGYAIWELAKHKKVQEKLREEIASIPLELTYENVQSNMPYLDAVTRETLRLHPAAPYMERVAAKDDILPLRHAIMRKDGVEVNQVAIKAGQTIIIPIHSVSRANQVWGDGTTFRPERWLEQLPPSDILPTGWSNLLAFSDGPRNCIGYRLAIFQFKVILLSMIRKFEFNDTGAVIINKVTSSMQPVCVGKEKESPMLPVGVTIL